MFELQLSYTLHLLLHLLLLRPERHHSPIVSWSRATSSTFAQFSNTFKLPAHRGAQLGSDWLCDNFTLFAECICRVRHCVSGQQSFAQINPDLSTTATIGQQATTSNNSRKRIWNCCVFTTCLLDKHAAASTVLAPSAFRCYLLLLCRCCRFSGSHGKRMKGLES